jgi:hypothetical protein
MYPKSLWIPADTNAVRAYLRLNGNVYQSTGEYFLPPNHSAPPSLVAAPSTTIESETAPETRLEHVDCRLDETCGHGQQSVRSEAVGDRTSILWQ